MAEPVDVDTRDLARLHRALATVDKQSARNLTTRVRRIAQPIAEQVKRAALATPSKGKRGNQPSLREGVARAVEIKTGRPARGVFVRIRVSGTKFEARTGRSRRLPRYLEGLTKKPWRHPVWPDKGAGKGTWKGVWAVQSSHPYLLPTVLPYKDRVGAAMQDEYLDTFEAIFRAEGL